MGKVFYFPLAFQQFKQLFNIHPCIRGPSRTAVLITSHKKISHAYHFKELVISIGMLALHHSTTYFNLNRKFATLVYVLALRLSIGFSQMRDPLLHISVPRQVRPACYAAILTATEGVLNTLAFIVLLSLQLSCMFSYQIITSQNQNRPNIFRIPELQDLYCEYHKLYQQNMVQDYSQFPFLFLE